MAYLRGNNSELRIIKGGMQSTNIRDQDPLNIAYSL